MISNLDEKLTLNVFHYDTYLLFTNIIRYL